MKDQVLSLLRRDKVAFMDMIYPVERGDCDIIQADEDGQIVDAYGGQIYVVFFINLGGYLAYQFVERAGAVSVGYADMYRAGEHIGPVVMQNEIVRAVDVVK